jgi:hypothetical protein
MGGVGRTPKASPVFGSFFFGQRMLGLIMKCRKYIQIAVKSGLD